MKRILLALIAVLAIVSPLFANGTSEEKAADGVKVVTLRISHNMDFTTIPDAVVGAAERLNAR